MGGATSEIADDTTRVLLEAAYFTPDGHRPHLQAPRAANRGLGPLRTGLRPLGDRPGRRPLLRAAGRPPRWPRGSSTSAARCPGPLRSGCRSARVNGLLGTALDAEAVAHLLEPIGFAVPAVGGRPRRDRAHQPARRPPGTPRGGATSSKRWPGPSATRAIRRRQPSWPEPGRLTAHQRERRRVREVLCRPRGLRGVDADPDGRWRPRPHRAGAARRWRWPTRWSATSRCCGGRLLPGMLRALAYNADRRQGSVRLFEVGTVFSHPDEHGGGWSSGPGRAGRGRWSCRANARWWAVALGLDDDDARAAVAVWEVASAALRLRGVAVNATGVPRARAAPDPVGPAGGRRTRRGHRRGGRGRPRRGGGLRPGPAPGGLARRRPGPGRRDGPHPRGGPPGQPLPLLGHRPGLHRGRRGAGGHGGRAP